VSLCGHISPLQDGNPLLSVYVLLISNQMNCVQMAQEIGVGQVLKVLQDHDQNGRVCCLMKASVEIMRGLHSRQEAMDYDKYLWLQNLPEDGSF